MVRHTRVRVVRGNNYRQVWVEYRPLYIASPTARLQREKKPYTHSPEEKPLIEPRVRLCVSNQMER